MTGHVGELLERHAEALGDKAAIVEPGGRSVTFRGLRDAVARFSGGLDARGCGSHVLVLHPMGIELYVALLGVIWGGRTAVLVDPSIDRRRLDRALSRIGLDAFAGSPKAHLLRLLVPALRGLGLYAWRRLDGAPGPRRSPGEEPALITFTTGTTGVPKAIGRSHAFLLAQHAILAGHMGLGVDDVDLPTLPVFLLNSLAAGATCVLPDGDLRDVASIDPGRVLAQIDRHGVTTSSGSPAFFAPLAARVLREGPREGLRKVFVGGARVRPALLGDLRRAFPAARIEVVYGSTEAEPIATIDAESALAEADGVDGTCVGAPVPGVTVRLLDHEVLVAGAHVVRAYYRDTGADAANKLRDGDTIWHRTGDAGWQDEQGRLWLVGRVGEQVAGAWPFPVEARAERVAGVTAAALADVGGEPVLAYVGTAAPEAVTAAAGVRAVRVERIPVDPRHRAKTDRAALATLLR